MARETLKSVFILLFDGQAPQKHYWSTLNPLHIEGAVRTDGVTVVILRFGKKQRKRMAQIKRFVEEYNSAASKESKVKLYHCPDKKENVFASSDNAPYTDNEFYLFVQSQEGHSKFVWDFVSNE